MDRMPGYDPTKSYGTNYDRTVHQPVLGMSLGRAKNILHRKIIWAMLVEKKLTQCFRCGGEMTEADYSQDHAEDWLYASNGRELYFDLNNIRFSHRRRCNVSTSGKRVPRNLGPRNRKTLKSERGNVADSSGSGELLGSELSPSV